jgi:transposase
MMEARGERTIADIAESLGIAENLLHNWRKIYSDTAETVRKERGETAEDELKRLRRENAQLKRDKEILKNHLARHAPSVAPETLACVA